jgi:hypothetical protein
MMMKMNKKRKKSGMSMDKGMKMAKSTKKGMAGDDMSSMDTMPMAAMPMKKMGGGTMGYAHGGMVNSRGNGMARGKKTRIC